MGRFLLFSTLFFVIGLLLLFVGYATLKAAYRYKKNDEQVLYKENLHKARWMLCIGAVLLLITFVWKYDLITI